MCSVGCIVVFACFGRRVAMSVVPGSVFTLKSFLLTQFAYRTAPDDGALVIKAFRSSTEALNSLYILSFFLFFLFQRATASFLMHDVLLSKTNEIRNTIIFNPWKRFLKVDASCSFPPVFMVCTSPRLSVQSVLVKKRVLFCIRTKCGAGLRSDCAVERVSYN